MSLHYGHVFGGWGNPTIESAAARWREYDILVGLDLLWRVEAVRYAGSDEYGDGQPTDPRLELFALPVKRWTEHGATLVNYSRKWTDLRDGAKQYASRTPQEALKQFQDRRKRQIYILEKQLARAKFELNLAIKA